MSGFVYIMGNTARGTLYIGVTNNLERRVSEHKIGTTEGFTKQYDLKQLFWYEAFENIETAILKEKQMKAWKREWKINTILKMNPDWCDLSDAWYDEKDGPQPSLG
jgi:putative endonuclease